MTRTLSRRDLLAWGCSAAAAPLATPMAFAALPSEHRLVVVILRGGMDGLDALRPWGDPNLAALRPGFDTGPGELDLDGFHALHPALAPLAPWWREGGLGFAQAVSTPYRGGRSHFDGQDVLETGLPTVPGERMLREGWLNRLLAALPGATARTAMAVGRDEMLILRGTAPHGSWAPDQALDLDGATRDLLLHAYHDDPLFLDAAQAAMELSGQGAEGRGHEQLFAFAAAQLRADARIAALSTTGWDTHRGQAHRIGVPLGRLAEGLMRLRADLGDVWERTTVVAMTEFGRTARQNGSNGTDHGTGGVALLAGGALNGGRVWGVWPGLNEADLYEGRDLMPTGDVRAYMAWAIHGLFGTPRGVLEAAVFPGLEMGPDPRLLA
jgi:uncharacterized protein (DUF1501 family)